MAMIAPRTVTKLIDGKTTSIFLQTFSDRIFVLVTQLGKVGNLIQATLPVNVPLLPPLELSADSEQPSLPPPPPAINLTTLLGSAPSEHMRTLYALYASQIATIVWYEESQGALEANRRGVIVGLALTKSGDGDDGCLTDSEKAVFNGVMSELNDLLVQN